VVQVAHVVRAAHEGQDRVEVVRLGDAIVMVVADGSGGMSGGAQAAELAIREIMKAARTRTLSERASWISMLADADSEVADGLLKYGGRDRIAVLARGADLQVAVRQLAELPRLRSGALPDDVGVILCRS
jgi:serine/threonine protein phosphatase PrpC